METIKVILCGVEYKIEFIKNCGFDERIFVKKTKFGYKVRHEIKNISSDTMLLGELIAEIKKISLGGKAEDDYFYANENARLFGNLTIPLDYNRLDDRDERNKKFKIIADRSLVDPGVKEGRILSSPYQPFPALLISNYKSTKGIICGSLSQDYFYHNFEVGHEDGKAYLPRV